MTDELGPLFQALLKLINQHVWPFGLSLSSIMLLQFCLRGERNKKEGGSRKERERLGENEFAEERKGCVGERNDGG